MMRQTKVKICGLTRPEEITYVNEYQPEYVGFVFAKSRRQVDCNQARNLRRLLDPQIQVTGVFVNESEDVIARLCENKTIDVVQLHGEEDESYIRKLRERIEHPIIKAVRVRGAQDILAAEKLPCEYLLLDTYMKGQYGGSGKAFDLGLIPRLTKPFFLAGGLTAEQVQEKIHACHPYAVDISSGVEGEDGLKDREKIRIFIEKVREEQ